MPIFHYAGSQKRNGGHRGDRTLHRTRSWFDRTCPVSSTQQSGARVLGFATGASGHLRDRHVRSGAQRELKFARSIGRAARLVTRDRTRPVVEGAYWTPTGAGTIASGRCLERVRSMLRRRAILCDRRVQSVERRVWSLHLTVGAVTVGGSDTVERVRSVSTSASGRPKKRPVKGYNGSIRLGCL
jgi:hypothetical protein